MLDSAARAQVVLHVAKALSERGKDKRLEQAVPHHTMLCYVM